MQYTHIVFDLDGTLVDTEDAVLRCKPLPDPLLLYCERTGREPGECIYVGDAPGDAAAAGMDFALVDFSGTHGPCMEGVPFFRDPAQLGEFLLAG
ncbi:HAD hydrolase-like protein [uncultured Parolsenella sp.]|uniref:HAD hydrolase-like protein n=1 Tax=uncultured Parolsenella sp. TaxID=2083008 RepID=UPI0027DC8C9C|nr:HAD hydrolase-like protein [uncultured Parolsenella sp.]